MTLNRSTAGPAMVAFFETLLGTPYSESSPPGSDADGHLWVPGEGKPNHLDCSGASYYVVREQTGLNIDTGDPGNAQGQWDRSLGGRVTAPLLPGDLLFFRGATPPVGHVGMCVSFNNATGAGTYISAYDTAEGLVIKPFSIHGGVDGYVGAVRVANALPPAPAPAPAPTAPAIAHLYARSQNMVEVDPAEATMAVHKGISYYTWTGKPPMSGSRQLPPPGNKVLWAFRTPLDKNGIPHAGS